VERGRIDDAIYFFGLTRLMKLRLQVALGLRALYPTLEALRSSGSTATAVAGGLGSSFSAIRRGVENAACWQAAREAIARHVDAGMVPLAITDPDYPPLLRGIVNPPAVLFAKGDLSAVRSTDAVAVVGSRKSTPSGERKACEVARRFAQAGYVVVAGLARGIDTCAHAATVEAGGRTVAVYATPLDRVYPAENRPLERLILASGGAVVSEYAIGDRVFPGNFKHRDRIQAGMSIAVIPVQAREDKDGTMHTVRYGEGAGRLIFCPTPPRAEARSRAHACIRELLATRRAEPLRLRRLPELLARLEDHRDELMEQIGRSFSPIST